MIKNLGGRIPQNKIPLFKRRAEIMAQLIYKEKFSKADIAWMFNLHPSQLSRTPEWKKFSKSKPTPIERFWKYVKKTNTCWNWTGGFLQSGYGIFTINNKIVRAHRFSYELHKNKIPVNLNVCHSCDNPKCVNPSHLWLGTHKENMDDMMRKGRKIKK